MSNTCIKTAHLGKSYDTSMINGSIIKDINLSIDRGTFTVIMGNSGSGKSTLLYLLSGLDECTSGKIWINNIPVHQRSQKDGSLLRRKMVGFVFQDNNLVPTLTIRENIVLPGYLINSNRKSVNQRADELMDELGILSLAKRYPAQISGGEAQRAAIGRAMINDPLILLADEPTGNLNSEASEKVLDCFAALHRNGQTIVMVTHDLSSACRGCQVIFLKDGTIASDHYYAVERNDPATEENLFNWLKNMGW